MAKPTPKNPVITASLDALLPIGVTRNESIETDLCVFRNDGKDHSTGFTDALSVKEFSISGICQTCQDSLFV